LISPEVRLLEAERHALAIVERWARVHAGGYTRAAEMNVDRELAAAAIEVQTAKRAVKAAKALAEKTSCPNAST
jgi:hypothetical protein